MKVRGSPRARWLGRAALGLLVGVAAGCGPFRLGSSERATIIFTNESLDQADVYATLSGTQTVRLGTVLATRTDTLNVPRAVTDQGGSTSIVARLLARTYQPSTGPIFLRSTDVLRVRLTGDGRSLIVTPAG